MLNTHNESLGRAWSDRQAARLEALASDTGAKFKSRRYDLRRKNGDPTFGARMAESHRSRAVESEQPATRADIDALIAQIREISRLRY
jgi:hypothetical protein